MKQLPPGQGRTRTVLYDKYYRPLWDSAVDTTPAYRHISDWCNATIDDPDGTHWFGQFYRCPEGVKRWSREDLPKITAWPNPIFEDT